ncbi:MAG: hypothetical protein HY909_31595 [Deltaproteobacteria bacterium]|nr:hypothetical protein [Deltaproteobacteria bacterium]
MARTFIQEVMSQTVTTTAVYSSGQFYEMLGRPNKLAVQIVVDSVSGAQTVSAELQHSNDGADNTFGTLSGATGNSGSISAASNFWLGAATITPGAFIRVKVSTSTGTCVVRVIICGRDE